MLDVNTEPGELTGPDRAEPLVVLSDTSTIRVRAFVEELDAPRVAVGMPAQITADGLPDTTFIGRVIAISPRMETKSIHADRPYELYDTKVREVFVELTDEPKLIVGLRVDVRFGVDIPIATTKLKSSSPNPANTPIAKGFRMVAARRHDRGETFKRIVEAAALAPSAENTQPW